MESTTIRWLTHFRHSLISVASQQTAAAVIAFGWHTKCKLHIHSLFHRRKYDDFRLYLCTANAINKRHTLSHTHIHNYTSKNQTPIHISICIFILLVFIIILVVIIILVACIPCAAFPISHTDSITKTNAQQNEKQHRNILILLR